MSTCRLRMTPSTVLVPSSRPSPASSFAGSVMVVAPDWAISSRGLFLLEGGAGGSAVQPAVRAEGVPHLQAGWPGEGTGRSPGAHRLVAPLEEADQAGREVV